MSSLGHEVASASSTSGEVLSTWMPCLGGAGLLLFGATADQRAALGEDVFSATHFPMEMKTQAAGRLVSTMTQEQLLTQLLTTRNLRPGNRIFVLYGAAGAGKSELLRWLVQEIPRRDPTRERSLVRISRTELDVVRIVERFQTQLSGDYFSAQTLARWEDLRNKPLTLAKLLVLTALDRLLTRDEEINALFYWLTAPVQRNLEEGLAVSASNEPDSGTLELFSEEDWTTLAQTTQLSQLVEPEALRAALVDAFRSLLLENVHLPETLGLISEDVRQRHGVRPILLIDDLVRSLNLFAGDIMDYFITLESGNWDVVIGVTPSSLQTHTRGRQFLERIAYLDTIDDRVQKVWLSDDFGHESYFLHESNCAEFAARYLDEYRRLNGITCNQCALQARCENLGRTKEGRLLAPFNQNSLQRVLRAVPSGKGKARYFLLALADMLQRLADGDAIPSVVSNHAHREFLAHAKTKSEAAIIELYASVTDGLPHVAVDPGLGQFFDFNLLDSYRVEPLSAPARKEATSASHPTSIPSEDPQRGAIRRWIEGQTASRHLLHPVRQGIARWLRLVGTPHVLYRQGVARPYGILHWEQRYLDLTPPIILTKVDDNQEGMTVGQELGLLAFDFAQLARAKGEETRRLATRIAEDKYSGVLVQAARELRIRLLTRLETQLGVPPASAAMHLYIFALCLGEEDQRMPGFPERFWYWLTQEQARRAAWRSEIPQETRRALVQMFADFFRLRENIVDGPELTRLCRQCEDNGASDQGWLRPLLELSTERLDPTFMLGDRSLADVIKQVQEVVSLWLHNDADGSLSPAARATLDALSTAGQRGITLAEMSSEVWAELASTRPELLNVLRISWEQDDQNKQ